MLQQSLDLLQGQVIYRDMDSFVAPGMWFLLAAVFKVFGESVFVSRMLMLAVFLGLGLIGYRIVTPLAGWRYGLATVFSLLLFSIWAFPTWTFAFYSPVAILLALAALERLLAWQRSQRNLDLALTGLLLGLSICFKQNYGVFALIGATLGYAAMRFENKDDRTESLNGVARDVALISLAMIMAGVPFLIYFLAHGAVGDAWLSLVVHPFEFAGRHDIPYAAFSDLWKPEIYNTAESRLTYLSFAKLNTSALSSLQPIRAAERLHVLLYWIAPLVLISGLILSVWRGSKEARKVDSAFFACFSVSGCIFFGVFPRADFNHLVNVYQPVVIATPLAIWLVLNAIGPTRSWLRRLFVSAVSLLALVYGGIAIHWYMGLLERLDTRLEMPRAGVFVNIQEARHIELQVRAIRERSKEGDAVLTIPDLTMLNFLSERQVPSKWYNLYEHHIAADQGKGVVEQSEDHGVDLVMTRFDNFFSDRVGLLDYAPVLSNYVITHYERDFIGNDENFIVYRRRTTPELETPFMSALTDCESDSRMSEVRNHLLFSAIYHKSHPMQPIPEEGILTLCRVHVPDEANLLSLDVGYRKPSWVESGTTLDLEISLMAEGGGVSLLKEEIRILPKHGALRQQPFERFDLDLSAWAGQKVVIEFKTHLLGKIQNQGGDLRGFAAVYRDARLQQKASGARP